MKDTVKFIAKAFLILHLLTYTPSINAHKQISMTKNGQGLVAVDNNRKIELSGYQRVKRGIVDSIKSFLKSDVTTNAILFTVAPIVKAALPYVLVPLAIVPLAGLVSSFTGKERRETEENLAEFFFKELPAFIKQMVNENRKSHDKSSHVDDQKSEKTPQPDAHRLTASRSGQGYPYDFHFKDAAVPQT